MVACQAWIFGHSVHGCESGAYEMAQEDGSQLQAESAKAGQAGSEGGDGRMLDNGVRLGYIG